MFEQYNYDNLLVINPLATTLECQYGARVCCRISSNDFAACVSENDHVTGLMDANLKNLYWGTYNYKIHENVYTNGYFPQYVREREAFEKVAQGKLKKDFMILEHAGSDFIVAEGSFIGRIVALGDNHASVRQGIAQGRRALETTFEHHKFQHPSPTGDSSTRPL